MNGENNFTSIFIVAASPIVRAGLEALLQNDEKIIIMGSAPQIPRLPSSLSNKQADFDVMLINVAQKQEITTLLDFLNPKGETGTSVINSIALLAPDLLSHRQTLELLRAGIRGIFPRDAAGDEIIAAIHAAANNLIVFPAGLKETIFSSNNNEDFLLNIENEWSDSPQIENLTMREREVLEMLVEGASNKIIADRMNISEHTVKFHIASVFGKLGVNSRTEAVTQALRRGIVLL